MSSSSLSFVFFQMTNRNLDESNRTLMFDENITLHLQSKWIFLKHLLGAIRIDSFGIVIEKAQLKMLLVKILAENIDMELPITLEEFSPHTINTFSRGYHKHMSVWMPQIGDDSFFCRRELRNEYHKNAASIVAIAHFKREEVVGRVPLFLSKMLYKFCRLPGSYASCKVTGTRINRGIGAGLEIPIEINFAGKETATEWHKKALHRINMMIEEKVLKCKK